MGKSLSLDLRQRLLEGHLSGKSSRKLAKQFCVAPSTVIRLVRNYKSSGLIEPARQGRPSGSGKLSAYKDFVVAQISLKADITMPELARLLYEEHTIKIHPSSLSRLLRNLGYRYKKNTAGGRAKTP